jgi:hypothetical protein
MAMIIQQNTDSYAIHQGLQSLDLSYYENNKEVWPLTFLFLFNEMMDTTVTLNSLSNAMNQFYEELNNKFGMKLSCSNKTILNSLKKLNKQNHLKFESGSFLLTKSGYELGHKTAHMFLNHYKVSRALN